MTVTATGPWQRTVVTPGRGNTDAAVVAEQLREVAAGVDDPAAQDSEILAAWLAGAATALIAVAAAGGHDDAPAGDGRGLS